MAEDVKLPGIPSITPVKDQTVASILRPIKESLEIIATSLYGIPANSGALNTAAYSYYQNLGKGTSGIAVIDPNTVFVYDYTPPPAPTGLSASGAFQNIILSWDNIPNTYGNHSYTEVWRASTNAIGAASLLGFAPGSIYVDSAGLGETYYYWIRYVSTSDVTGNYNSTVGTMGATGKIGNADLGPLIVEAANLAAGAVDYTKIDPKQFSIQDALGNTVFGADGYINSSAFLNLSGNNVALSTIAANALVPSLNYVGEFSSAPTQTQLGDNWKQNAVYKNSTDGQSYVLTGSPLGWVVYLVDGKSFTVTIESTNGTIFRPGAGSSTVLKARLFKNGAEVTDQTPLGWFRWRRVSAIPQASPNDDATWNSLYASGYNQVTINVDDVYARATFFCDIIST